MDAHTETSLRIDFERGQDIDITVVEDGNEIDNKIFNKNTHQVEEVIDYINSNEYSYDVYF